MVYTRTAFDLKVISTLQFQPPGELSLWSFEPQQPFESTVVCADDELTSTLVLVGLYRHNNCQEFLARQAVVSLTLVQLFAVERNHLFLLTSDMG